MADIVFVAIALTFFGLAAAYVLGCDRIIGRETPPGGGGAASDHGAVAVDQAETGASS
jgi:hypothetical protein